MHDDQSTSRANGEEKRFRRGFCHYLDDSVVGKGGATVLFLFLCEQLQEAYRAGWEAGTGEPAPELGPDNLADYSGWMERCALRVLRQVWEDAEKANEEK